MPIVQSTTSQFTNDVFNSLSIRDLYDQLIDPHVDAMPTWRIALEYKVSKPLNPKEEFEIPIITKDLSPSIAVKNDQFPLGDIDNVTTMAISPVKLKSGAATNDVDLAHMSGPLAVANHVDMKVNSMHRGMTKVLNTMPFFNWNETILGKKIDISALLANASLPPEELVIKNVSSVTDLPASLPMAARKTVTGHTFQNIATTTSNNLFWQPVVTDASGATVTRATTGDNIDAVTAVSNLVELSLDDLVEHLDQVQEGRQYTLLAATPRKLFMQLRNIIMAANMRNDQSPLADLGIESTITFNEYNTTFYLEPKMSALWPSSIFFWDPECFRLYVDPAFDPTSGTGIYPWERISGTTTWGTMIYINYQYVCEDRRGVSAMHGFTSS